MGMLTPRKSQAEVIGPVIEWQTGDADAVIAHLGEIGKPQPARRMLLPEDDVLLGPVQRPPGADATLQRAADTGADLGMAAPDLVENSDGPQARNALEQRHHLAIPNRCQRILPPAPARRSLLRREPGVLLNAIGGRGAEYAPRAREGIKTPASWAASASTMDCGGRTSSTTWTSSCSG